MHQRMINLYREAWPKMGNRQPSMCRASLAVTPVVFGPLGIVAGAVAAWKAAKWWGTAGVSASLVAAVVGFYLAVALAM